MSRCTTILVSLEPGRLFLEKAFTYLAENFLTSREFVEVSNTLLLGLASALCLIHTTEENKKGPPRLLALLLADTPNKECK